MFDLSTLMAHKQSYVTVMLNKRPYTNNIAVFDMFTVILPNTFNFFQDQDATTLLVEAILSMKRCDIFLLGDYRHLQ